LQVAAPRPCLAFREVRFSESLGQIPSGALFLVVRHKASERFTVLQKHKRHVLIVRSVDAIGKIARGLGYAYARFLHNLIIRLSDFLPMSSRSFLRLDQFLKSTGAKAEENVPNPKLFP